MGSSKHFNENEHPRQARTGRFADKNGNSRPGQLPDSSSSVEEEFKDFAFTDFGDEWLDDDDPRMGTCHLAADSVMATQLQYPRAAIEQGDHGRVYITDRDNPAFRSELKMDEDPDGMMLTAIQQTQDEHGNWQNTGWGATTPSGEADEQQMNAIVDTAYRQACNPESNPNNIDKSIVIAGSKHAPGYMGAVAVTGGKYDASRTPAENVKLMRSDLKALQKNGELPKDYKISLRKGGNAYAWSANFTIQLPENESPYYVPTYAEYEKATSEERLIGPEHRAAQGIIESHGGSISHEDWDKVANHINRKIRNKESLTGDEQRCVIETPKVRHAKDLCRKIGAQYTYDGSNPMVDYYDSDGLINVNIKSNYRNW